MAPESFSHSLIPKRRLAQYSRSVWVSSVCRPTRARIPGPMVDMGVGCWFMFIVTDAEVTR